jgi:hypothetical protein
MDRTIDTPIPIPGGKTTALAAFRIGNRKEGAIFRKKLLVKTKGKDLMESLYQFRGRYPKFGFQQMEFTLERLKKIAMWDKNPLTSPPEIEDEDPDPEGWDDWHPVCEYETDDSINLKKEAVAKKLIDSEIPPERIKNVMDAIENNLDILRAPRAGA